tara:strand:- start:379 stop:1218 length:840 start_codon:yes stop_codon:yes gene_type:complete
MEKVSAYIPAFNAEKTIEECINSLITQSIPFNEVIIVNDNSNDNTLDIVKKYSSVKIINNKLNMGLSYSRNEAIKHSTNDIIAGLDADVVLDKYWLEKILVHLKDSNNLMCGGQMREKLINNKFNNWRAKYYSQNWGKKDLLNPPFLFGCNTLQRKKVWVDVDGYDEKFKTNGEDIDYSNKIKNLNKGNLFYCSEALCYHLQDDNLETLSNRVWRYHGYGYKLKNPSLLRFFKLSLKQFKFMLSRVIKNLFQLNFENIFISVKIFFKFIELEYNFYKKK